MKLTPIGERVVLKPLEREEKTKSGIYIPKSEDRKEGIVESVGTLKNGSPIPLNKGDRVLYGGYSSEEMEINSEKFLIIDYKDILARIQEDE